MVFSGFWEVISIKGAIEIMLLPESPCIHDLCTAVCRQWSQLSYWLDYNVGFMFPI